MLSKKYVLKILTAGDGAVGKTTLLHSYINGKFLENSRMTIGVEFLQKRAILRDDEVNFQLWDFGGQQQFRHMLPRYVLGAKGALLLFDLTRIGTLFSFEDWVSILRKHKKDLPILLVGTKVDLEEEIQVDDDYVLDLKEQFNFFDYLKVSSKTGENLNEIFEIISKKIIET